MRKRYEFKLNLAISVGSSIMFSAQLTQVIADKEKKSSSYREGKLDTLSEEKVVKIKKFSKDYIAKILRKMEKSGKRPKPPSISTTLPTPSTSTHTPNSNDGKDISMLTMSVEEAMDMDPDSGSDAEEDDEMVDGEGVAGKSNDDMPPPKHSPWTVQTMDLDESLHSRLTTIPSDPRRRAPPDD